MKSRLILFLSLVVILGSCSVVKYVYEDDRKIEVVFLQMNDVYEIAPLSGGAVGGMARVATVLKQLKRENPNTMCVLAGDFLSPSLMGNLKRDGKRIKGEQMVQVMNAVGVDIVTFGNHEFDLKMPELQERLNESEFMWLGTSVRQNEEGKQSKFYKDRNGTKESVPDTYVWEVADKDGTTAKIGLFGTTIDSNPKDFVHYQDFYQRPIEEAARLDSISDIVIGLTHLEVDQDVELARQITTTVPLFMGGHDHDNMMVKENKTAIAKADANAKSVYIHRLVIDKSSGEKVVTLSSELKKITDGIPSDPAVEALVEKWTKVQDDLIRQICDDPYEKVYTTSEKLDARESSIRNKQTNYGMLMTKAMTAAAKTEVVGSFTNGGSTRIDDILTGDIYAIDLFRALPFGGGMLEIKMKGRLLTKMLNQGQANKGRGGYLQLDKFNYNPDNQTWSAGGQAIQSEGEYRVAVTDFLLTGLESGMEFFTRDNPDILEVTEPQDEEDIRNDIRLVFIDYLKKMK